MLRDADYRPYVEAAVPLYFPATPENITIRLLSLSENATYMVSHGQEILIFRVHRPFYHDVKAIKSEQLWVELIRTKIGINTPVTVPNIHNETVSTITIADIPKNISVCSFISGTVAEESLFPISYSTLGELTAHMHKLSEDFSPATDFHRFSWDIDDIIGPTARWGDWHDLENLTEDQISIIEQAQKIAQEKLKTYGKSTRTYGLTHFDLRMSNVMVGSVPEELTIIDFDDLGWSWYLFDLANILSFDEDRADAAHNIHEWLAGYTPIRSLSNNDLAMIPTFVILRRIQLIAWIASHSYSTHAQQYFPQFAENSAILAQKYLTDPTWLNFIS